MQKSTDKIHFTQKIIESLYDNYAKLVFCGAIRVLIEKKLLNTEEKQILSMVTGKIKETPDFLKKSYIIYLSNGILSEEKVEKIMAIKGQLIFELAVQVLEYNLEKKINYTNKDENLYSLCLNQPIKKRFDYIVKCGEFYSFYKNGDEVYKIGKNNECNLTEDINFLVEDRNPFNTHSSHPDDVFVAYDLKEIPREKWVVQFKNAYKMIKENTPEIYNEIYYFLDAIVPHGHQKNKQLSSSYSASPGILYLSYTDSDIIQAEAIIHEVHHTIFNIIDWKYPLCKNDMSLKYYSSFRPDARHIKGCFIGLHAFVAVQSFYSMLAKSEKDSKFIDIFISLYLKNKKTISVLEKYAEFTDAGKKLFRDIKLKFNQDTGYAEEIKEKFADILSKVNNDVEKHLEDAKKRNKVLLY